MAVTRLSNGGGLGTIRGKNLGTRIADADSRLSVSNIYA